jgi:predicted ATP-grasp superfamily ATP-dependent carboligase
MTRADDVDARVAAVVVGGGLNGLGVVRSLAGHGIPIVAVDTQASAAALWSRYARPRLIRSLSGREFVEDMLRLGESFNQPPVLLLTDEQAVHAVSENRDELSKSFRFRLPVDENVKLLSSKASFHDFSLQHDFPVPRSVILESKADINRLEKLRFPCVLKPVDKRSVLNGFKERAIRVDSQAEARAHADVMLSTPGAIIAQEWIEGPESNIYFTLLYRGADGEIASMFTGRKLSCHPHDVGSTATCVAAPEAREILEEMTLAFAARAGMDGMGSMEYKWDDVHQRFVMIEPTVGRTDWQEEIATLCGVNIPLAAYRHELGLPALPEALTYAPAAWCATIVDSPPRDLLPVHTKRFDGFFRWNDPMPAVKYYCMNHPLRRILRYLTLRRDHSRAGYGILTREKECQRQIL